VSLATGYQFTCFTGTKVLILTQMAVLVSLFVSAGRVDDEEGGEWEVEEVTVDDVLDRLLRSLRQARGTHFTCFGGTKVQILTTSS
jgi:hypothetical protein